MKSKITSKKWEETLMPNAGPRYRTKCFHIEVAPSETKIVDAVSLNNFWSAKYLLTLNLADRTVSEEFSLVYNQGTIRETVGPKLGGNLAFLLNTDVQSNTVHILITNNEPNTIRGHISRSVFGE
jgi:hypothetical protein